MRPKNRSAPRPRWRRFKCWLFHERRGEVNTTHTTSGHLVSQVSRRWCLTEGLLIYERWVNFDGYGG